MAPADFARLVINRLQHRFSPASAIVAATLPDGRRIAGAVLVLSDYMVTIREADGTRHTVNRTAAAKVEVKDPLQAHADQMKILTDRQMHDLTAYLAGVK